MKVSIVSINRERVPEPLLPLGPAIVAAVLRAQGHEVRILDLCHQKEAGPAIASHLMTWQPDLVGINLRQMENNQMIGHGSYLEEAKHVVEQVKGVCSCPIVVGGAAFSLFPGEALRFLDVPYGLAGEAEHSVTALVRGDVRAFRPRESVQPCSDTVSSLVAPAQPSTGRRSSP